MYYRNICMDLASLRGNRGPYRSQGRDNILAALKQCSKRGDLEGGKVLHLKAVETGCHTNRYVANALITMYSKCRSMWDAHAVFTSVFDRDVVSWTSLITGYTKNGDNWLAIDLFWSMDCEPNSVTFVAVLKACVGLGRSDRQLCLEKVRYIHARARERGVEEDTLVATNLMDVYCKCGSMQDARAVFDKMAHWDVVSWNILILGYVENEESLLALELLARMYTQPNSVTFVAALKACTTLAQRDVQICLEKGVDLHIQARERGFDTDIFVETNLVDMYCKCGRMQDAHAVFDSMAYRNVVSWNILLHGYVEDGQNMVALDLFTNMQCEPDSTTFVAVLKACTGLATEKQSFSLEKGMAIHRRAGVLDLEMGMFVANSLVDMYMKCGSIWDARAVFDRMLHRDVVTWNILVLGYVENGHSAVALEMFNSMDCEQSLVSFVTALKACASVGTLEAAQCTHTRICKLGLEETQVVATSLVDCYGKCGTISTAEHIFGGMLFPNLVSWNALIAGYSLLGDVYQVLSLVKGMQKAGLQMDSITFLLIITSCSHAGMVEEGKNYFKSMSGYGVTPSVEHYHCVVDMLGRANKLQEALSILNSMPFDASSFAWTTLLGACRNMNNLEVSKVAFEALVACDDEDSTAAYVLMGEIYNDLVESPRLAFKV